jgi:hypothetical protein
MVRPFTNFKAILNDDQKEAFEAHMMEFNYQLATALVNSVFLHKVLMSLVDMNTRESLMPPIMNDGLGRLVYSLAKSFGLDTSHLVKVERIIATEVETLMAKHADPVAALKNIIVLDDYSEGEFSMWYKRVAARVAKEVL